MNDVARKEWIPNLEIENAQIKWAFSHFDGRADTFNEPGNHNFQVLLPEADALALREQGWNIREMDGYEEGDPKEYMLKVVISFRYEPPKMFLIKNNRKFRIEEDKQLADVTRAATEKIDVIIKPSRWVHGQNSGISAYVEELYVTIKQSRFGTAYEDYEEAGVGGPMQTPPQDNMGEPGF